MQTILRVLTQNLPGIVLAIIGLITAYVFYRRSLIKPRLAYKSRSFKVTGRDSELTPDLKILYRGAEVERVTKSTLVIWNCGNATVDGSRIVDSDPLRVGLSSEGEILDASIFRASRDVNACAVRVRPGVNELLFSFDYLDPNDGAVVEILHTGDENLNVSGTVRGMPHGVTTFGSIPLDPADEPTKLEATLFLLSGLAVVGLGLLIADLWNTYDGVAVGILVSAVVGGSITVTALLILARLLFFWIIGRKNPPQFLLPLGFTARRRRWPKTRQ